MNALFLQYAKCSACVKAKKWLEKNGIAYEERPIIEQPPTIEELKEWVNKSGLPLKKFFNTSGLVYKSLNLKDKLPAMSQEEQYALLASDGKLVKRPLVVQGDLVLVGFREEQWEQLKR